MAFSFRCLTAASLSPVNHDGRSNLLLSLGRLARSEHAVVDYKCCVPLPLLLV